MNKRNARLVLAVAFFVSLVVHAVIATRVDWRVPRDEGDVHEVQIVHQKLALIRRTPVPTTPPTPRPTMPPTIAPSPRASSPAKGPRAKNLSTNGTLAAGEHGKAAPVIATAPPTPRPVPTLDCASHDTPVTLLTAPSPPAEIPPDVRAKATSGVARVRVSVDESGAPTSAVIADSTGNAGLDSIATTMARAARYTPATHNCKPIAAEYAFAVRFSAW